MQPEVYFIDSGPNKYNFHHFITERLAGMVWGKGIGMRMKLISGLVDEHVSCILLISLEVVKMLREGSIQLSAHGNHQSKSVMVTTETFHFIFFFILKSTFTKRPFTSYRERQ